MAFTFLLDCVGWLGFRFSESSGTTCIWTFDYVDEVILQTVLPFVIAGVVVTAYFVHKTYYQRYYTGSADVLLERLGSLYNMYSTLLLTLTYLLLTSTVTTIFRMFPCADVDPNDEAGGADMFLRVRLGCVCLYAGPNKMFVCRPTTVYHARQIDIISAWLLRAPWRLCT